MVPDFSKPLPKIWRCVHFLYSYAEKLYHIFKVLQRKSFYFSLIWIYEVCPDDKCRAKLSTPLRFKRLTLDITKTLRWAAWPYDMYGKKT